MEKDVSVGFDLKNSMGPAQTDGALKVTPETAEETRLALEAWLTPGRALGAVLFACRDRAEQALLALTLPGFRAAVPADPEIGAASAPALLGLVRPGLVIVDDPASTLGRAAQDHGIPVATMAQIRSGGGATGGDAPVASYPDDIALILQTSGTTGQPKLVGLSGANLAAGASAIIESLGLGPTDRTAAIMPLTHVHGLVAGLLAPVAAGGSATPVTSADPDQIWRELETIRPTWLSMAPAFLRALLDAAPKDPPGWLSSLRVIRTASAPLTPDLRVEAEDRLGAPVIQAYGMTEASHQIASERLGDTRPGSVGRPAPDLKLAIRGPDGVDLPEGEEGEICLKGPSVIERYLSIDAADDAFQGGWLRTGDIGRIDPEGDLWLVGRLKDQIQRGGETLAPLAIETALLAMPGLAEVAVFPEPHPTLGEEVAALCVLEPGAAITEEDVLAYAADHLRFAEAPKHVVFAEAAPRTGGASKVDRTALVTLYARSLPDAPDGGGAAPPPSLWRDRLREAFAAILGLDAFSDNDSFFALGGDSLSAIRLLSKLKQDHGAVLPLKAMITAQTVTALAAKMADASGQAAPTPIGRPDHVPASAHITSLFKESRLLGGGVRGRDLLVMRPASRFSGEQIKAAWAKVVDLQPALRQILHLDETGELTFRDVGAEQAGSVALLEIDRPINDLSGDPFAVDEVSSALAPLKSAPTDGDTLVRAVLLQDSDGDRAFLVSIDEMIADGFSKALLPLLMEAALLDRAPAPETPFSQLMTLAASAEQTTQTPAANPPFDGAGPRGRNSHVSTLPLDPTLWRRIEAMARDQQVTVHALCAGAFAHVLNSASGQPTTLWCAIQDRTDPAAYLTLGNCTALARMDLPISEATNLIAAARAAMGRLFDAVGETGRETPDFRNPPMLFEIADEAAQLAAMDLAPEIGDAILSATRVSRPRPSGASELSVSPPSGDAPGAVRITADAGCFSEARAAGLLRAYLQVLDAAVNAPEAPLADHRLADAYQVLAEHPSDPTPTLLDPTPENLAALFDRVLDRWPDRPAMVWKDGRIKFARLNRSAKKVEALLLKHDAQPGDVIGFRIANKPTADACRLYITTQIAAFRIGCAIMPMGQQIPGARALEQIQALSIRFVMNGSEVCDWRPEGDETWKLAPIQGFRGQVLAITRAPRSEDAPSLDGVAFIFTSSGSTGKPKTILVSHEMMLGNLEAEARVGIARNLSSLMGANIGFDVSFTDVWMPWLTGGYTVLLGSERRNPRMLAEAVRLGAGSTMLTPGVALSALRDNGDALRAFDEVMLGGEAVPPSLARSIIRAAPGTRVINVYGTTENGVIATLWNYEEQEWEALPVGLSLPGYKVLIANTEDGAPAPAHWPGEILIASPVPATGYLDPDLTAARFRDIDGRRFFRTGDAGWIGGDGLLRVAGRIDRQTKISGVRVEIGEIEQVLRDIDDVHDCAVTVLEKPWGASLAAVLIAGRRADPASLKEKAKAACQQWLPRAAQPTLFAVHKSLPLGSTGKVDHAALRAMLEAEPQDDYEEEGAPQQPVSDQAARIADMWVELLTTNGVEIDHIPAAGTVMEYGATSLDVVRMAERLEAEFDVEIAEDQLFLNVTPSDQADLVAKSPKKSGSAAPVFPEAPLQQRFVRSATSDLADQGTVVGLCGWRGEASAIGAVSAHTLPEFDIVGIYAGELPSTLMEGDLWRQFAEALTDRIVNGETPRPKAIFGFSFAGWMAWVIDRMLIARGLPPTPLINLDGSAMHHREPELADAIKTLFGAEPSGPRSKMLLLHRTKLDRFEFVDHAMKNWSAEAIDMTQQPFDTVAHNEIAGRFALPLAAGVMSKFALSDGMEAEVSAPLHLDTPGGAIHQVLQAAEPPTRETMVSILRRFKKRKISDEVRHGLLISTLFTGNRRLAKSLCERLQVEDAGFGLAGLALETMSEEANVAGLLRYHANYDGPLDRRSVWTMLGGAGLTPSKTVILGAMLLD